LTPATTSSASSTSAERIPYGEMREAYLKRALAIHPDRARGAAEGAKHHAQFVALQDAWHRYYKSVDAATTRGGAGGDEGGEGDEGAGFTGFGVGCSFSDNPLERDLRAEIMDQAGRGFLQNGMIAAEGAGGGEGGSAGEGTGTGGGAGGVGGVGGGAEAVEEEVRGSGEDRGVGQGEGGARGEGKGDGHGDGDEGKVEQRSTKVGLGLASR
jgi:hypothetical protein